MPWQIVAKAGFLKVYDRLSGDDRHRVDEALGRFRHYLQTREAPVGFGIKHLGGRTYEFRAGLALRVVYVVEQQEIILALLGTHDEVRRFLKRQ